MEHSTRQNPLAQYFRQIKLYLKLPSGTTYYSPEVVKFTDSGEIGVLPMTGKDELILKNPDALLNGEAIVEIINSCVPAVSDPKQLLSNDIDAIITAIRYATYNDSLETEIVCPGCGHDNLFKLDLQYSLDNMTYLDPEYVINLDSGASVFVKPYGFMELLKFLHAQFEESKLTKTVGNESITEEQRIKMFSSSFKTISQITFDIMCDSIIKVVDESKGVNVTDKEFIREFAQNIDKKTADKISDTISEINKIGIKRSFLATCEKCAHQWENEIDFNPVNFL